MKVKPIYYIYKTVSTYCFIFFIRREQSVRERERDKNKHKSKTERKRQTKRP